MEDNNKINSLIKSRRFWVAVGGVAVVCAEHFGITIDSETVQYMTILFGSWIVGDSMRKTE